MKKMLRINNEVVEMTLEQVIKRFKPMMIKETRKHTDNTLFNAVEYEDLMQVMEISTWKAFESYELSYGTQFSTHLFNQLIAGKKEATGHLFAQKRQAEHGIFAIEDFKATNSGADDSYIGLEIEDEKVSVEQNTFDSEIIRLIYSNATEMEIDILNVLILESQGERGDKKALAEKYGCTRKTIYRKIEKMQEKFQELLLKNDFVLN